MQGRYYLYAMRAKKIRHKRERHRTSEKVLRMLVTSTDGDADGTRQSSGPENEHQRLP